MWGQVRKQLARVGENVGLLVSTLTTTQEGWVT